MVHKSSLSMLMMCLLACLVPGVPGGTLGTHAGPGITPPSIDHDWSGSRSLSAAGTGVGSRTGGSNHQDSKAENAWRDIWDDSGSGREEGGDDEDDDDDDDEDEDERNVLAYASPVRSVRGKTEVINLPEALKTGKVKSTGWLWREGSYEDWCDAQELYNVRVSKLGERSKFIDAWFHAELPASVAERSGPAMLTKDELALLVEWAAFHRGGCAVALATVMGGRSEEEVEEGTAAALRQAKDGDVPTAMRIVAALLGEQGVTRDAVVVGSALLAAYNREMYPFFSEEAIACCPDMWGSGWTVSVDAYERFCECARRKASTLNKAMVSKRLREGKAAGFPSDDDLEEAIWTAVDVIGALWAALVSDMEATSNYKTILRGPIISPTHPPSLPRSTSSMGPPLRLRLNIDTGASEGHNYATGDAGFEPSTPTMPMTPSPPGGRGSDGLTPQEGAMRIGNEGNGNGGDWGGGASGPGDAGAAAAAAGDPLIVPQTPSRRYSVTRTPFAGSAGEGWTDGGAEHGVGRGDGEHDWEEDEAGAMTPVTPSISVVDEEGYCIDPNQMYSNQGEYNQEGHYINPIQMYPNQAHYQGACGEEYASSAADRQGDGGWVQYNDEVMDRAAYQRAVDEGCPAGAPGRTTPGRGFHSEESQFGRVHSEESQFGRMHSEESQFGRMMRAPPQTPHGPHAHRFAPRDVRQRVDHTVQGGKEVLDVGWAAGRDATCSEVLYVLGRASREIPNLQVLRCVGLDVLSECQDCFRLLLLLVRKHPSLWSLNLSRVPLTPGQQTQLCHALRTCHVSHMACEATGRYLETMSGIAASNARKHTLWMLSSDNRQNSVIQTVQGCWHDPMDHPDNLIWQQEHARPRTPAPRTPAAR